MNVGFAGILFANKEFIYTGFFKLLVGEALVGEYVCEYIILSKVCIYVYVQDDK